jgi:hypothetical protein
MGTVLIEGVRALKILAMGIEAHIKLMYQLMDPLGKELPRLLL